MDKPIKLFTMDTETRGLFGGVFRLGLYDGEKYHAANETRTIKDVLKEYSKEYDCHVFIHNLDFDIAKMAHEFIPESDLKKSVFINNNVTMFHTNLTTEHERDEQIQNGDIVFHDSLKLVMGSLAKICKDFGLDDDTAKFNLTEHIISRGWAHDDANHKISSTLPKEEILEKYNKHFSEGYYFENVEPFEDVLNHYLRKDCESLFAVIKLLIEISGLALNEFLKCPTTASLALKVFQLNYPKDYKMATSSRYFGDFGFACEQYIREGYYGGRTETFVPYAEGGFHYDVNSLYPSVMKNYKIPYGKYVFIDKPQKVKDIFNQWFNFRNGTGFMKCKIEIPENLFIPPLPLKRFNKLIFPTGKIIGTWTFEEIEKAMQMGAVVHEVISCMYFEKSDYLFKNFVNQFEDMKINSKGAKRFFAKTVQNSLYGKFGMQRIRKTLVNIKDEKACKKRFKEKGLRYQKLENPLIKGEQFIEAETLSNAQYIQPHIAAYITAMARLILYDGLIEQNKRGHVYYCDTDSIACESEMDEFLVHDSEYGKWKLESTLEYGLFLQPKLYYEKYTDGGETRKFKGVPKNKMVDITKDTYHDLLERMKEIQLKVERGEEITKEESRYVLFKGEPKRIKFATSLKNGLIDFDQKQLIQKSLLLTNVQKREMDYINNNSKAHHLEEF